MTPDGQDLQRHIWKVTNTSLTSMKKGKLAPSIQGMTNYFKQYKFSFSKYYTDEYGEINSLHKFTFSNPLCYVLVFSEVIARFWIVKAKFTRHADLNLRGCRLCCIMSSAELSHLLRRITLASGSMSSMAPE